MRHTVLLALVSSTAMIALVSCKPQPQAVVPLTAAPSAIWPAPDFTLEDYSGTKITRSNLAGQIVVLEWTNPDCCFCQRHAQSQTFKNLAEKYRPRGVVWMAIDSNIAMNHKSNADWAKQHKLPYPVLDDRKGRVARLFNVQTTPTVVIIDRDENIAYCGAVDNDPAGANPQAINYVDKALRELLNDKAVAIASTSSYGCKVRFDADYTPLAVSLPPAEKDKSTAASTPLLTKATSRPAASSTSTKPGAGYAFQGARPSTAPTEKFAHGSVSTKPGTPAARAPATVPVASTAQPPLAIAQAASAPSIPQAARLKSSSFKDAPRIAAAKPAANSSADPSSPVAQLVPRTDKPLPIAQPTTLPAPLPADGPVVVKPNPPPTAASSPVVVAAARETPAPVTLPAATQPAKLPASQPIAASNERFRDAVAPVSASEIRFSSFKSARMKQMEPTSLPVNAKSVK